MKFSNHILSSLLFTGAAATATEASATTSSSSSSSSSNSNKMQKGLVTAFTSSLSNSHRTFVSPSITKRALSSSSLLLSDYTTNHRRNIINNNNHLGTAFVRSTNNFKRAMTTSTRLNANVLKLNDPQNQLLDHVDIFIFDCDGVIWKVRYYFINTLFYSIFILFFDYFLLI